MWTQTDITCNSSWIFTSDCFWLPFCLNRPNGEFQKMNADAACLFPFKFKSSVQHAELSTQLGATTWSYRLNPATEFWVYTLAAKRLYNYSRHSVLFHLKLPLSQAYLMLPSQMEDPTILAWQAIIRVIFYSPLKHLAVLLSGVHWM